MALPVLSNAMSLDAVSDELQFTLSALRSSPPAADQVLVTEALLTEWLAVYEKERQQRAAVIQAQAAVHFADYLLDDWVDRFHLAVLSQAKGDKDHPQYVRYFGIMPPSRLKQPVLGEELEALRGLPVSLAASGSSSLQTLGKELETLVHKGDAALAGLQSARSSLRDFQQIGGRSAFVDRCNVVRKQSYADLGKLVHTKRELGLPKDYADAFFRHQKTVARGTSGKRFEVEEQLAALSAQVDNLKSLRESLLAQEKREEEEQAQVRAEQTRLAELEADLAKKKAEAVALRSKLGKKPTKK